MFYGVSSTELGQIHLVFELMELRSLAALLESDTPLPWPQRQQFAAELARGMQHLHGLGMIHRDLKSDNCLVSFDMHAKVTHSPNPNLNPDPNPSPNPNTNPSPNPNPNPSPEVRQLPRSTCTPR